MKLNVLMLGSDGVGKTCYLAALHNACWIVKNGRQWSLVLPFEQRSGMLDIWRRIADPHLPFPPANEVGRFKEWNLSCEVESTSTKSTRRFTPIGFAFYDYAGDIFVQKTGGEFTAEFTARIKTSDAVMGVFDGEDILDLMKGTIQDGALIERYGNVLMALRDYDGRNPIHIVITKWDIIEPTYKLNEVCARLLRFPMFREFVDAKRRHNLSMRLIPVSAVGRGFAARNQSGIMTKVGADDIVAQQENIEIPVAVVLHDALKTRLKELEKEKKITRTLRKVLNGADPAVSHIPFGSLLLFIAKTALSIQGFFAKRRIKDERTALESVVIDLEVEKRVFDARFPDNVLIRGK